MASEHIVLLVVALAAVGLVLGTLVGRWTRERARRAALRRLAERLGMRFATSDRGILERHSLVSMLGGRRRSQARNVLVGRWRGHQLCIFDFYPKGRDILCYESRREAPGFTVFVLEHEQSFPSLRIYPETAASKLAQALGYEDIDFESVEFSDAFCVRSRDRKFAYDVCHPRMMAYLLSHRDVIVELADNCIALCRYLRPPQRHRVEAIPYWLKRLVTIRKLLPAYLFEPQDAEPRAVESARRDA